MNKTYIKRLLGSEEKIRVTFDWLWTLMGDRTPTAEKAQEILKTLYDRSMLDILQQVPEDAKYYPAKQGYRGRLKDVKSLWWVDHATGGVNGWSTLSWFSNRLQNHVKSFTDFDDAVCYARRRKSRVVKKYGKYFVAWKGYSNAITHFVVFPDGTPFMLLPLEDGCWAEPKRNGDSIQIEMVNPLIVTRRGTTWEYWGGKLPTTFVEKQPPELLATPFRGAKYMAPYTREQMISNIKLKRLCMAATNGRMSHTRMSQHTDWRERKYDMGPLWPFDLCNQAAFERYPIESYNFLQNYPTLGIKHCEDSTGYSALFAAAEDATNNHDTYDSDESVVYVKKVQKALVELYGLNILPRYGVDGALGDETTEAVRRFQGDWNTGVFKSKKFRNVIQPIKVDGVPGVVTYEKLKTALDIQPT
ncbi:MAG: peptidoglycan-binding domain-containing protein [Desulfobacteraceae bacterium]|jgi:hypothetical protein